MIPLVKRLVVLALYRLGTEQKQGNIREISGGKSGAYLMANLDFWPMFGGKNEKQRMESLP